MQKVTLKGIDSDRIEVAGLLQQKRGSSIELDISDPGEDNYIAFNDGTLLKAWNDTDDVWRFEVVEEGTSYVAIEKHGGEEEDGGEEPEEASEEDEVPSDVVSMEGNLSWLVLGIFEGKTGK